MRFVTVLNVRVLRGMTGHIWQSGFGTMMSNLTPEQAARKQGRIALVLDQEAAEFYIELLHDYNAGRTPGDVGVFDDENYLRRECELMFGEDTNE